MARYINADALLNSMYNDHPKDVMKYIAEYPTADVVEVVRCKDCIHYKSQEEVKTYRYGKTKLCSRSAFVCTKPTDFCSFGERIEDDQTNDLR